MKCFNTVMSHLRCLLVLLFVVMGLCNSVSNNEEESANSNSKAHSQAFGAEFENITCGNAGKIVDTARVRNQFIGLEFERILRYKRSYGDDSNSIRGPYNADRHSSFVELVIVVDNGVYQFFGGNRRKIHKYCKDLVNVVNAIYAPLNIFVALVGVVIWSVANEITLTSNGTVTLENFIYYRRTKLSLTHPNDNAQLLTTHEFAGGVLGKAGLCLICTHEFSGGFTVFTENVDDAAATMAHEMGHNLGMQHDTSDCKCDGVKCFMSAFSTSVVPAHWSSCSIDQLNIAFSHGMNYCLRNKPTKLFESPECGNGFVEPGEQCDCGLPKYCANTCCDPYTCMLHANATCATGECCDLNTCRPKSAGTACRVADNECDLPEYCTGVTEYCPVDVFKRDTELCDKGQAYCYEGNCRSHTDQCRMLWGPTGVSAERLYSNNTKGTRFGNCGLNRLDNSFIPCRPENAYCGMLQCQHLNEKLEFGNEMAAVKSVYNMLEGKVGVLIRTALVDLGLQRVDPGLTPNGAKCGDGKMCLNQQCLSVTQLRSTGVGRPCPDNCHGQGVCNSRGNCHCNVGFTGPTCRLPGPGGSVDSGPATNPSLFVALQRFMYIFVFAVLPLSFGFGLFTYYCRRNIFLHGDVPAKQMDVRPTKSLKTDNSNTSKENGPHTSLTQVVSSSYVSTICGTSKVPQTKSKAANGRHRTRRVAPPPPTLSSITPTHTLETTNCHTLVDGSVC